MTLLLLLLTVLGLYLATAICIASGIHARYRRREDCPFVSIVVPARNEEDVIAKLLESLTVVDYPSDRLEILVINDQSTDRTREIAESFRGRFVCHYEIYDVEPDRNSELRAKTRPLTQGLDRARGEFVLMPDADNRVPASWPKCIVSYFTDGVGMVCGTTLPDSAPHNRRLLTAFETVDAALLMGTCAGFSGRRETQALIGSNFAVRRAAYEEVGTYRSLQYHEIEDLSLLHALQATGRWKAVFPADPDTLLLTRPHRSFGELVQQRRRWMGGWLHVRPAIRAALTAAIVVHVFWPFFLLLPWPWFPVLYGMLAAGDGLVAGVMLARYRRPILLFLLPLYPIFVALYAVPLLVLLITRREVVWKERAYA